MEKIFVCPNSIYQVLINLFQNSLSHAFAKTITPKITIQLISAKNALELHYIDNGKGIDLDDSRKIFAPFYTTKRGEGSSGLGLIPNGLIN